MAYHWYAAPAKTPDGIIHFLADAFKKTCDEEDFKKGMDNIGMTTDWDSPEGAIKSMEQVERIYMYVIKKHNIQPQ